MSFTRKTGNMGYILPRNRPRSIVQASRITPPLRGSRQDKGEARSRAGGGQTPRPSRAGGGGHQPSPAGSASATPRPVSDDQRHYLGRGGGCWLAPPPHQPSPAGSASATPPQGGSDTRGTNRGCRLHVRPGTWVTSATESAKKHCAGLKYHSPLEGESARPGRSPQSSRRGAGLHRFPAGPRPNRGGRAFFVLSPSIGLDYDAVGPDGSVGSGYPGQRPEPPRTGE